MSVTRRLRRPHIGSGINGSTVSGFRATSWASSHQTASKSKSCIRAPSGLSDSEDSENGGNASPGYSFKAPSGYRGKFEAPRPESTLTYGMSHASLVKGYSGMDAH